MRNLAFVSCTKSKLANPGFDTLIQLVFETELHEKRRKSELFLCSQTSYYVG